MKKLSFILLTIIAFSSCKSPYVSEIQTIDSLLTSLDSARKVLHLLDTGLVYRRIETVNENMDYITSTADSVNREQAFAIDAYANSRKVYNKLSGRLPSLFEEMETLPVQLNNLKNDLSKNLLGEKEAKEGLANERMAAEVVVSEVFGIRDRLVSLDEQYTAAHEKILLLIQSIDSAKSEK